MSDTVSFAELDGQHVELLAARTVLSMFSAVGEDIIGGGGLGGAGDLVTGLAKAAGIGASTPGSTGTAAGAGS